MALKIATKESDQNEGKNKSLSHFNNSEKLLNSAILTMKSGKYVQIRNSICSTIGGWE